MDREQVLNQYVSTYHTSEVRDLQASNVPSLLILDYVQLTNYFLEHTGKEFYRKTFPSLLHKLETKINTNSKKHITVKLGNVPETVFLRELDADNNGDWISTKAMIKNITEVKVYPKKLAFLCKGCARIHYVDLKQGEQSGSPVICGDCGGKAFDVLPESSEYRNVKYMKVQEPLELRTGANTREIKVYCEDYLASPYHNLKAGDVVDLTGVFEVRKVQKHTRGDEYEFIVNAHNITPVNDTFEETLLTEEDINTIKELSKEPMFYDRLVNTVAPEIYGYDTVKEALLLQMLEGNRPRSDEFLSKGLDRWTIHVLLIGDPGIGKSQIMESYKKTVPKVIGVNGAGTSQAGLTATAVKDELTGSWTMDAGAGVLADGGSLCIDEFDKLRPEAQKSLNELMEQLSVTVAKAGLVQTMPARTSVLAACNPKYGRYNPLKTFSDQVDIPDSTLSRFDLVFCLQDHINPEHDLQLATALLDNDFGDNGDIFTEEIFKKTIIYAKKYVYPKLNSDAKKCLRKFYVDTRKCVLEDNDAKPITTRDLKALERLTIAHAKAKLSQVASIDDARAAIRIYREALSTIGLVPENAGELSKILSNKEMEQLKDCEDEIKENLRITGHDYVEDVYKQMIINKLGITATLFQKALYNVMEDK